MAAERCSGATAAMIVAAALLPAGCASAPPVAPKPVPVRLLQFLGSSDPTGHAERSAGGTWLGYLSHLKLQPPPKPKTPAGTVAANRKAGS